MLRKLQKDMVQTADGIIIILGISYPLPVPADFHPCNGKGSDGKKHLMDVLDMINGGDQINTRPAEPVILD